MQLSYRSRLILGICLLVLFSGAAATWLAHRSARSSTTALADQLFREVSSHAVTRTRDFVMRAPPIVESLAKIGGKGLVPSVDEVERALGYGPEPEAEPEPAPVDPDPAAG